MKLNVEKMPCKKNNRDHVKTLIFAGSDKGDNGENIYQKFYNDIITVFNVMLDSCCQL